MSLFQCENCGCCENTALSCHGFKYMQESFDWSEIPERKGMMLCSACGPTHYRDGTPSHYGKWHNRYPRVYLPMGMFCRASNGNLEHIETGNQDYHKYSIQPVAVHMADKI